jgi:hypothetical protein
MMLTKLTKATAASLIVSAETVRQPPTAPPTRSDISLEGRA